MKLRPPYVLLTALYCAGIFYLSSRSDPPGPSIEIPGLDKAAHAVLYSGLAATLAFGFRRSNEFTPRKFLFLAPIGFAACYGLSDEIHQLYVPERSFEVLDVVADGSGALAMQLFLCGYLWKEKKSAGGAVT